MQTEVISRKMLDSYAGATLEDILSGKFMRISKSTIVNLSHVYALTQSISGCSIQFANTHKQVYVSRRYYKLLRERMKEVREKI